MPSKTVEIINNFQILDDVYRMVLPYSGFVRAGQFVMVRSINSAYPLGRAISVSEVGENTLELVYQAVGRGTKELSRLKAGDKVTLTGPIGHGFNLDELKPGTYVALIGGGVGTAPMVLTARRLMEKGMTSKAIIGFADKSVLSHDLSKYCLDVVVCTESGREGSKGLVTDCFDPSEFDVVYCCGTNPMMKAVTKMCIDANVPVYISSDSNMACGMGACLTCTCTTKDGKNHRSCVEGPVFKGEEVDFDA